MDAPTPGEGTPKTESGNEEVKVYEITPTKTEEQKIIEKIVPTETVPISGPTPVQSSDDEEDEKKDEGSLLDKIETGLKIKKPASPKVEGGEVQPKTPENVWVERVNKIIRVFKRKPFEEQEKAQNLEEGYLEEQHEIELKDNGER